jgi:hypothetical protein
MRRFSLSAFMTLTFVLASHSAFAMCARDLGKDGLGMQRIRNSCGYLISFGWRDQGRCNTGCLEWIGPNQTHVVYGMQGEVKAGECQGYCKPRY